MRVQVYAYVYVYIYIYIYVCVCVQRTHHSCSLIPLCALVCVCSNRATGIQKAKTGTQVRFRAFTIAGSVCIGTLMVESDGFREMDNRGSGFRKSG